MSVRRDATGWHQWKRDKRTGERECLKCGVKMVRETGPDPYTPTMRRFWLFPDGRKERAGNGCIPPICETMKNSESS